MTYFRFGIRDLLWAMVVVAVGLLAWQQYSVYIAAQEKIAELESTVQILRVALSLHSNSQSMERPASKVFGDILEKDAVSRPEDSLQEFLRTDKGHLLLE